MKRRYGLSLIVALLAHGLIAGRAWSQELTIELFDSVGQLSFNELSTAETYRVEGAPSAAGPWTNTWDGLSNIVATGSDRVVRGGSWLNDASYCRVAFRYHSYPNLADLGVGFRAVVPPGQ